MAPPANKKIQVTFLWADHAAIKEDIRLGYSKQLVDWATAFYAQYGFALDVKPAPGPKLEEAKKYALAERGGYEPDVRNGDKYMEQWRNDRRPIVLTWDRYVQEAQLLESTAQQKRQAHKAAVDNARNVLATHPADIVAELAKVTVAYDELTQAVAAAQAKRQLATQWDAKVQAYDQKTARERSEADFDTKVRFQLADKIWEVNPFWPTSPPRLTAAEFFDIADPYRLKVIFCRFRTAPSFKAAKGDMQTTAGTKTGVSFTDMDGKPWYDRAFILVNLDKRDRIALAHEIVHAAGRKHIRDYQRMKAPWEWDDPPDPANILPAPLSHFFEHFVGEDAAYHDGPNDDIINYNSMGKDPNQVKLYDKALLDNAEFVVP